MLKKLNIPFLILPLLVLALLAFGAFANDPVVDNPDLYPSGIDSRMHTYLFEVPSASAALTTDPIYCKGFNFANVQIYYPTGPVVTGTITSTTLNVRGSIGTTINDATALAYDIASTIGGSTAAITAYGMHRFELAAENYLVLDVTGNSAEYNILVSFD